MIDWIEIENRFRTALLFLDDFRVPCRADFERHEASLLTGGLVASRFIENSSYFDFFLVPGGKVWFNRARQLQLEVQNQGILTVDGYKLPAIEWRRIIASCIERRELSNDFLKAWSIMEQLSGRLFELDALNTSAHGQYKRELATGLSTNLRAQKCWYALWLKERDAIETRRSREAAQEEMLDVCWNAHRNRLLSPLTPDFYDAAWFRRLLRKDGKRVKPKDRGREDIELTGSLARLSNAELQNMASDPFIVPSILPPLYRAAFIEISTAP